MATVTYYGPDDQIATKVVLSIFAGDGELTALERWYSRGGDVRLDTSISREIGQMVRQHGVSSLGITEHIIGCPHEPGRDFPEGQSCPECQFWADNDSIGGGD